MLNSGKKYGYLKNKIILLLFLLISLQLFSQRKSLRFHHYTTNDGLLQNMVDCILQDSKGYMWFGTWNGLCRFDGYTFKEFRQESETGEKISNNFIYSICEDNNGNIWVGTDDGLNVFIYNDNRFILHSRNDVVNPIPSNKIDALLKTREGVIFIGTDAGLTEITIQDETSEIVKLVHHNFGVNANEVHGDEINTLLEDKYGNIWIGTNQGANVLNPAKSAFQYYTTQPNVPNNLPSNNIQCLYEDSEGFIWLGTDNGLSWFNRQDQTFTNFFYTPFESSSLVHNSVMSVVEDLHGNIIVGTLGGLSILKKNRLGGFSNYKHQSNNEYDLNNDFINCLYADKSGNIWVGTERGGINMFNSGQNEFEYFEHDPVSSNSLSHNTINSILEDDKYIWIGTAGGGINSYEKANNRVKYFKSVPGNPSTLSSDFITAIHRDSKGDLWVGTWGGGLHKMINEGSGHESFIHYRQGPPETSLINDFVSCIIEDKEGKLWIGTLGGLNKFDPDRDIFENFSTLLPNNVITRVGCLQFDFKNNLWVGTRTGLFKISDKNSSTLQKENCTALHFKNEPEREESLSGNYIISILADSKGNMWFGTYGFGLDKLISEESGGIFKCFTIKDNLPNNIIFTITEDNLGNLWMTTDNGLSRFDSKTNKFKNYFVADGLQNNQYYWSAAFKNRSGKLYFGGMNGLNALYPEWIKENNPKPKVTITDFRIFNESVTPNKEYDGRKVLHKNISETKSITISYKSKEFSIEFSALDYEQPTMNQYAYMLSGFDKNWTNVNSNRRFASYTNLKPDTYTFFVKATNTKGEMGEPTQIQITIVPPFWATWWFRFLLIAFIIALIISYNRYRVYSLQLQKRKLEKQVHERTAEIELQKEKLEENNIQLAHRQELIEGQKQKLEKQNHEILEQRDKLIELNKKVNLVNQIKLRFFTNISHEFRTPLTLILGPLEKLLSDKKIDEATKNTLLLINRNAHRMLHLINQLMDLRKIEKGKMELKVSKTDVIDFARCIFDSFTDLAENRQIEMEFSSEKFETDTWFDHDKAENIIYNLISNAFKYTPEKGRIWVKVYPQSSKLCPGIVQKNIIDNKNKVVVFEVGDTGIGISKENITHIFNRFYRVEGDKKSQSVGTGIGLSLVKELINIHSGRITVDSEPGKGSVFYVQFPIDRNHYKTKEITDREYDPANLQKQVTSLVKELSEQIRVESEPNQKLKTIKDRPLILIAEDNFDLREFIAIRLNEKFNILETENGLLAYDLAIKNNPDLIVSDIMMPEMDGLELCSKVKENLITSHIPVILLTAKSSLEHRIEGLEIGADDYLPKPFNFSLLETRITNLIESRKKLFKIFSSKIVVEPAEITSTSTDEQFLRKAIQTVEDNIENTEFDVSFFVKEMCVSRSLLHKKLTALTNQSAVDFINNIKLKKSVVLLKKAGVNISEVAYSVGFNDPKYFSRIFKKQFGKSPTDYQKEITTVSSDN